MSRLHLVAGMVVLPAYIVALLSVGSYMFSLEVRVAPGIGAVMSVPLSYAAERTLGQRTSIAPTAVPAIADVRPATLILAGLAVAPVSLAIAVVPPLEVPRTVLPASPVLLPIQPVTVAVTAKKSDSSKPAGDDEKHASDEHKAQSDHKGGSG